MPVLKELAVDWVSFVDRAAVRDPINNSEPARFLLCKREGADAPETTPKGDSMPTETVLDDATVAALDKADLTPEVRSLMEKAFTDNADLSTRVEQAEAATATAEAELTKAKKKMLETDDDGGEGAKKSEAEEARKAAIAKADPELRALLEKADTDRADLEERLTKSEEATESANTIAKAERETRLNKEFLAKAEGFVTLPIEAAKFGPILKSVSEKLTKEESDALDSVLKSYDEQIRQSELFKEMGTSLPGEKTGSAIAEVQTKAEALRKADPELTAEQALGKAMTDDRDLQERYLAENR